VHVPESGGGGHDRSPIVVAGRAVGGGYPRSHTNSTGQPGVDNAKPGEAPTFRPIHLPSGVGLGYMKAPHTWLVQP
jgi:hypothetical protein